MAAGGADFGRHSLALLTDGAVVGWGRNNVGQTNAPSSLSNVVAIAAGYEHNLAVSIPLKITSLTLAGQSPVLQFHTFSGRQYAIEYSTNLSGADWTALPGGSLSGSGLDVTVIHTNALANAPIRFYRLKQN